MGCQTIWAGPTLQLSSNVLPYSMDPVTFEDGGKGTVFGSRSLNVFSLSKATDVLLVDGLKVNLISISQSCDQDLFVRFTKDKYIILYRDQ